jgi:hypothetical protein
MESDGSDNGEPSDGAELLFEDSILEAIETDDGELAARAATAAVTDVRSICFPPQLWENRPGGVSGGPGEDDDDDEGYAVDGSSRHERFSNACASLLTTNPQIMQILLQAQSTAFRLHGLKRILMEAVSELSSLQIEAGIISDQEFREITERSHIGLGPNASEDPDGDLDLAPSPDWKGMTIASEMDERMAAQLGLGLEGSLMTARADMAVLERWAEEGISDEEVVALGSTDEERTGAGQTAGRPVAEDEKSNAEKDSLLPILGDGASAPDDNDDDDDDIWSGGGNEVFQ